MGFGKHGGGGGGGHDAAGGLRWLLTYADLITLLLVTFMILYALASQDQQKSPQVQEFLQALSNSFAPFFSDRPFVIPGEGTGDGPRSRAGVSQRAGSPSLLREMKEAGLLLENRNVVVRYYGDRVAVDVAAQDLFEADHVTVRADAQAFLRRFSEILKLNDNQVEVVAYRTLPAPAEFRDLWDLTSRQSLAVTRFLAESCFVLPERLAARALGPNLKSLGIAPNAVSPEGGVTLLVFPVENSSR